MNVAWFSAGCSSFLAAYLERDMLDKVVYIDIDDQHPDSMRFLEDAERLIGIEIEIIRSDKYVSVDDVIERERYINGPGGAACTKRLKKQVRQKWERENYDGTPFTYVWGYDSSESARAERMRRNMPEYIHEFPLVVRGIGKPQVHAICERLGIRRPAMYDLGYPNNNCIGCVKGGMGYWNKIRRDFPSVFERRAKQEREIGRSCIRGVFLDELDPRRGRMDMEIMPTCDGMCGEEPEEVPCDR